MKHNSSGRRGFTLIETIMSMVLIAIISVGIGSFILTSIQAWVLISGREAAVSATRSSMNRINAEMRRIRNTAAIITKDPANCSFTDLDGYTITFWQDGVDLKRNSDILATSLANPGGLLFTYLDGTGEVTAVTNNIRSIRTKITLAAGTQTTTLESSARIRNAW